MLLQRLFRIFKKEHTEVGPVIEHSKLDDFSPGSEKRLATLQLAVAEGGGFGDSLLQAVMLKEIYKLLNGRVDITFLTRFPEFYSGFSYIRNSLTYADQHDLDSFDVYIVGHRFHIICKFDERKVRVESEVLYRFLTDQLQLLKETFSGDFDDLRCNQYAMLYGKNRIEQLDVHDMVGLSRNTRRYLPIFWKDYARFLESGLLPQRYITVCRAVDSIYGNRHPKIWSKERYEETLRSIRRTYPSIKVVQVGASAAFGTLEGVDLNLLGKLTLQQTAVFLKNAAAHLDSEGGLVHLTNFVGGRSAVVFGPTDPAIYAYRENENLTGDGCPLHCEWISPKWTDKCLRGFEVAPCLNSISVDAAANAVSRIIDGRKHFEFVISQTEVPHSELGCGSAARAWVIGGDQDWDRLDREASRGVSAIFLRTDDPGQKLQCPSSAMSQTAATLDFCTSLSIPAADEEFELVRVFGAFEGPLEQLGYALRELLRTVADQGCVVIENADARAVHDALVAVAEQVRSLGSPSNGPISIRKIEIL